MLERFSVRIPKHVPSLFDPTSKLITYNRVSNIASIYVQVRGEHDAHQRTSGILDPRTKSKRPQQETTRQDHTRLLMYTTRTQFNCLSNKQQRQKNYGDYDKWDYKSPEPQLFSGHCVFFPIDASMYSPHFASEHSSLQI